MTDVVVSISRAACPSQTLVTSAIRGLEKERQGVKPPPGAENRHVESRRSSADHSRSYRPGKRIDTHEEGEKDVAQVARRPGRHGVVVVLPARRRRTRRGVARRPDEAASAVALWRRQPCRIGSGGGARRLHEVKRHGRPSEKKVSGAGRGSCAVPSRAAAEPRGAPGGGTPLRAGAAGMRIEGRRGATAV